MKASARIFTVRSRCCSSLRGTVSRSATIKQFKVEVYVDCPPAQARRHLDTFFHENPAVVLRVPVGPRDGSLIAASREVTVAVEREKCEPQDFDRLHVTWKPPVGEPFPEFKGVIEVEADEDYNSFRLILRGEYRPPFGIAGRTFDFVIGRRIALATGRDLLERMRADIEHSFAAVEAEKARRLAEAP